MIRTQESNEILKENQIDSDSFLQFTNDIIVHTTMAIDLKMTPTSL